MKGRKTMAHNRRNKNTLYCFSPPVMIATFLIELGLALYTVWRYRRSAVTRLTVVLLVSLSVFQLAEYMVCQGLGGNSLMWSRIGYVAITILPPVGLHLIYAIAKDSRRWLIWPGYIAGAAFVAFFALAGHSIESAACLGNYVIFEVAPGSGALYGAYYYVLLAASLLLGWQYIRQKPKRKTRQALVGAMIGYAIFIIPTTAATVANPETLVAIPSIMCGFAVLLAVALVFIVLPNAAKSKRKS